MVSLRKLYFSFQNAFRGLKIVFKEEQSFRIQLFIAVLVVILMFCLPLHSFERAILLIAISLVLGLELLNSQLERVLDFLQPNHDIRIKAIKDLSAAAVLIAAFGSALVGILIFLKYLL